ncbi:Cna B-type domain-containing protein [[Eubacterium] hominis]|uniref:Cna B-type domain-containing protein n=1 Tax=[Eubacterium] hominis TaxID=2764325 RepID=UPI003A4D42DB
MKRIIRSIGMLFATVFMFLATLSMPITATESGSITVINKTHDGELLADINVKLYKVADFTDGSRTKIKMTSEFSDFDLNVQDILTSMEAEDAAKSCSEFINANSLAPIQEAKTDIDGKTIFTGIDDGIYLIVQNQTDPKDYEFTSTPFFVQVPYTDKDGKVIYQVTTQPKNDIIYPSNDLEVSVVKLWKDNNNRDHTRPDSIEVGLYGDGELVDTVSLSDINNWSNIWDGLSKDVVWDVQELEIPDSYRMTVENNQNQFIITNQLVVHRQNITHGAIETVKGNKTTIKSVVTGDTTMLGFYIALFALSGLLIIIYVKRCKE